MFMDTCVKMMSFYKFLLKSNKLQTFINPQVSGWIYILKAGPDELKDQKWTADMKISLIYIVCPHKKFMKCLNKII